LFEAPPMPPRLARPHQRRLRELWRSAGWPCHDMVEVELLAAGLLERQRDADGRETLRVTDAGVQALAETLRHQRGARDAHETLVGRVALEMQRAGRIVWRGLSLRAALPGADCDSTRWVLVMPDVFSIRQTTVEDYVEPVVHEIKVHRADLLSDLRHPDKGAAYRALASQCWYVLRAGIGAADEVPDGFGVMAFDGGSLEVLRPAPRRAMRLGVAVWVALARAHAEAAADVSDGQRWLAAAPSEGSTDPAANGKLGDDP
jgi:hypothetical protein